jgi:EmrB/QacA subfamily drug resistance transporter
MTMSLPLAPPRRTLGRWAPLPVLLAGTFLVVLDAFVVNVALPSIQRDLGAGAATLQWVVAGYALASAVLLIPASRLGDRWGRRRLFTLGVGLFTASSAACGLAPTPEALVAARLAQGVAAALMTPNALSLIGALYTGGDRVRALSAYGSVMGVAAASGQLIGGALVQADVAGLGWRTCFLVNLPVGIVALARAARTIPESAAGGRGLDPLGTVLVTLGLTLVVLPLVQGRSLGWPAWTIAALAAAPLALGAFAFQQRRRAARGGAPLLEPALFARRSFSAGLAVQGLFWCGQASFFLVFALYLQLGRGLGALESGLVFTVLAVAYVVTSARAQALARHGRRLIVAGALTLAAGHGLLLDAVLTTHALAALVPGMVLIGGGMGLLIAPIAATVMAGVPPELAGAASGVLSTLQSVGNALGVAVVGALYFGALSHGPGHAFALCLGALALLLVAVAALARTLPAVPAVPPVSPGPAAVASRR